MSDLTPQEQKQSALAARQAAALRALPALLTGMYNRSAHHLRRTGGLQGGDRDLIPKEALPSLQAALPKLAASFLARELAGWERKRVLGDPRLEGARALEAAEANGWSLQFSEAALDALLAGALFLDGDAHLRAPRHRAGEEDQGPQLPSFLSPRPPAGYLSGDLLVAHMLLTQVRSDAHSSHQESSPSAEALCRNPMSAAARLPALPEDELRAATRFLAAEGGPLTSLWPWVADHLADQWLQGLRKGAPSLGAFHAVNQNLRVVLSSIGCLAREEGRPDKMRALLRFFRRWVSEGLYTSRSEGFQHLLSRSEVKYSQREEYAQAWASWLDVGMSVAAEYQRTRAIHPLDRDPAEALFMSLYEDANWEDPSSRVSEHLRSQINALRQVIT